MGNVRRCMKCNQFIGKKEHICNPQKGGETIRRQFREGKRKLNLSQLRGLEIGWKMKKPKSEATKQKMRKPKSEKHKQALKQWYLNNPEKAKEKAKKQSETKKRKFNLGELIPHNKDKTKENYEPLKRMSEKNALHLNEEKIINLYLNESKTIEKIADIMECSATPIKRILIKNNIHITKRRGNVEGENNPMFGHKRGIDGICVKCGKIHKIVGCAYMSKYEDFSKQNWLNPEFREKSLKAQRKGMKIRPNIPEKESDNLIQQNFPNQLEYTGDGKWFWLSIKDAQNKVHSFNPDFKHKYLMKLIEIFGDYWHNREDNKKRDILRLQTYARYGYDTLIIWENELKDKQKVIEKIKNFIEKC